MKTATNEHRNELNPRSATRRIIIAVIGVLLLRIGIPLYAVTVTVFAAASLTESLKEIASAYELQTGDKIVFNFAASGPLARQIEEGAPADIFFSADEAKADALQSKGLLVKETRRSRLSNALVAVVMGDSPLVIQSPADLGKPEVKRLALCETKTSPAGTYSKGYLEKVKLWTSLEQKVVPCENVRAVLAAVESGNVDAGIVYRTDAAISKKVKVAFEIQGKDAPSISYPMALVKDSKQTVAAGKFLSYLAGDAAGKTFTKYGFILLEELPKT